MKRNTVVTVVGIDSVNQAKGLSEQIKLKNLNKFLRKELKTRKSPLFYYIEYRDNIIGYVDPTTKNLIFYKEEP